MSTARVSRSCSCHIDLLIGNKSLEPINLESGILKNMRMIKLLDLLLLVCWRQVQPCASEVWWSNQHLGTTSLGSEDLYESPNPNVCQAFIILRYGQVFSIQSSERYSLNMDGSTLTIEIDINYAGCLIPNWLLYFVSYSTHVITIMWMTFIMSMYEKWNAFSLCWT